MNPYDLDEASASAGARRSRCRARSSARACASMRSYVAEFNVYRWAGRMLVDAARLRRRERLGRSNGAAAFIAT